MRIRVSDARSYILGSNPSTSWRLKVARMKPNQVMAIYYKFLAQNEAKTGDESLQITLFDTNPKEMEGIYGR